MTDEHFIALRIDDGYVGAVLVCVAPQEAACLEVGQALTGIVLQGHRAVVRARWRGVKYGSGGGVGVGVGGRVGD